MKRRILCMLLTLCLLAAAFPAAAEAADLNNFAAGRTYTTGQFSDVAADNTFADNVRTAYELGLMQGQSAAYFGVKSSLTRLAALIIACRVHTIYVNGSDTIESDYTGTLQEKYLQYAKNNGLYTLFSDWSVSASRAEYALILGSALPDSALTAVNSVEDGAIPDVPATASYYSAVYRLYRAGIMIGNDSAGTFSPGSSITRGAAAAIATRMASPALRRSITLSVDSSVMNAETVYSKYSSAVAYIEVQNAAGTTYASGSGFFIDSAGTFVTCCHVIDGASAATVRTTAGTTYQVSGVYAYSSANDWAVLKVKGSGFPFLTVGAASENVGGATVYAIGSPLGLENTISQGIISNTSRAYEGTNYLQTTASISSGSSGGALISQYGHVIGITAGSFTDGQNLNLAVPMTYVTGYSAASVTPLSSLPSTSGTSAADPCTSVISFLQTYGTVDSSGCCYLDLTDRSSGTVSYGYVEYDPSAQELCFTYSFTSTSGYMIAVFLNIPKVSKTYQVDVGSIDFEFNGSGTITAATFTDSSPFTFSSFTSTGGLTRADVADAVPSMICSDLLFAEAIFEEYGMGVTIQDFGFTAAYQNLYS